MTEDIYGKSFCLECRGFGGDYDGIPCDICNATGYIIFDWSQEIVVGDNIEISDVEYKADPIWENITVEILVKK